MDYIGNKTGLTGWILPHISRHLEEMGIATTDATFLDACTGTGVVSVAAAEFGFKKVIASDLLTFPAILVRGKLLIDGDQDREVLKNHINTMNRLPGIDGFFTRNYASDTQTGEKGLVENDGSIADIFGTDTPAPPAPPPEQTAEKRLYLSKTNGRRVDACREYLNTVEQPHKDFLLYCLLEAFNRVSNTASVHGAFLKTLKSRARAPLELRYEAVAPAHTTEVVTFQADIQSLFRNPSFREMHREDVLYLDPPYTERQYAPNYHLYETLVRQDNPKIHGKTGIRDWGPKKSQFCSKAGAQEALRSILADTCASLVVVSYSSDGILPLAVFEEILSSVCDNGFEIHVRPQRRFKADSSRSGRGDLLREYLFIIRKTASQCVFSPDTHEYPESGTGEAI